MVSHLSYNVASTNSQFLRRDWNKGFVKVIGNKSLWSWIWIGSVMYIPINYYDPNPLCGQSKRLCCHQMDCYIQIHYNYSHSLAVSIAQAGSVYKIIYSLRLSLAILTQQYGETKSVRTSDWTLPTRSLSKCVLQVGTCPLVHYEELILYGRSQ